MMLSTKSNVAMYLLKGMFMSPVLRNVKTCTIQYNLYDILTGNSECRLLCVTKVIYA